MTDTSVLAPAAPLTVALVGNPNTGKTALFNALTGAEQRVGNYPGITVDRKEGTCTLGDRTMTILDLPGAYTLAPASRDEQVVIDALLGRIDGMARPEAVICIVDSTNLRRNLFLVSQVAEAGLPIVVALNMIDEARIKGIKIDAGLLSRRLGVPVIPTVATRSIGVPEVCKAVSRAVVSPGRMAPVVWPDVVREGLRDLEEAVRAEEGSAVEPVELHRLLFDLESPRPVGNAVARAQERSRRRMEEAGHDPVSAEALLRYTHIASLLEGVVDQPDPDRAARAYAIDRVITHRIWGLLIFSAVMFLVFSSIYWLAGPLMDGIDALIGWLAEAAGGALEGRPMLQSLVAKGVIQGVGSVVIFLPQILILFLFIAVLEDSGYMSRAAFLMDKVFAWTGLNGKSFVPMLSSFACAIPGIMATRTIEDPKARLSTILVAPLMSCSARLPVYVLMIGAFIAPVYGPLWAGVALFAMHLLGLVVAIPVAFFVSRYLLRQKPIPFVLEMPPYRAPRARSVGMRMWFSGREFVVKAGTLIFAFSILIWALTYFPRPEAVREEVIAAAPPGLSPEDLQHRVDGAYLEQSILGRFGKAVQPVFAPAGFDWKITVGLLAAFPARELIVSTLGIIYSLGEEADEESPALRQRLANAEWPDGRPVYTPAVAAAIMVFFAFCLQCGSTVAVIAREVGWKWAVFCFVYMTALGWVGAVATYQLGPKIVGVFS